MGHPSGKSSDARRKSSGSSSPTKMVVTLKCSPGRLRALHNASSAAATTTSNASSGLVATSASTANGTPSQTSPAPSPGASILPPLAPHANDLLENSNPATPGTGTPGPMAPPDKKKGKRGPPADPKPRGKPGPKKKQRLEEGVEINPRGGSRLGPKANLGAINAGLRALDRSGKPCRKWVKGSFRLKTFTGVLWEIPRWTAPIRTEATPDSAEGDVVASTLAGAAAEAAAASTGGSSTKENKIKTGIVKRSPSANSVESVGAAESGDGDGDAMEGVESTVAAVDPAPVPIAAA